MLGKTGAYESKFISAEMCETQNRTRASLPVVNAPPNTPFVCSHGQPKSPCVFCVHECSDVWGLWRCYHSALLKIGGAGGICPLWACDRYHSSHCYLKARFPVAPHREVAGQR